ncbi:MAG: TlpA family protein disulfide reductase [Gammaproteobacteria bacterium]|nr:TlpA family protein disulfide reductase [Gammaproteobacteria bacterium]
MKTVFNPSLSVCFLVMIALAAGAETLPAGIMRINGTPAPALQLDNLDAEAYDLEASQGHWRFVHFWASWCGPCRKEMPSIGRMITDLGDSQLEIVLVNTAETEDEVFTFLGIIALDLLPLMDTDGQVTELWQPRGLPATYLVDPAGKIQYQALGGRDWDKPVYLEFLRSLGSLESRGD